MNSRLGQNCYIKGTVAFFISSEGLLFRVEGGNHISTVIRNPSKFGLTTEQMERAYGFFGEKLGVEGTARKQILIRLIQQGWIRLRRYPNKYWSANILGLTLDVATILQDWAAKFLFGFEGFREPDPYMSVVITGCFGKLDRFSMKAISEGALSSLIDKGTGQAGIRIRFLENTLLLPDSPCVDKSVTALEPRVGIFFVVDGELILGSMPISGGEDDGDFVNDPRSHHECWNTLARRMETAGAKRFSGKSYDYHPRGRCLYSRKLERFLLYVDPCIVRIPRMVEELMFRLQIPSEKTDVVSDDHHYRCAKCNPRYVPDL